jgi:biotin carboxyl carrier protein
MLPSKRSILLVTLILVISVTAWVMAAGQTVDHRSVLSGHVLSVVNPGTAVQEGTVLVVVGTLTGPIPAARATTDGVVKEVLVKPGDIIRQGDLVVRIEAAQK